MTAFLILAALFHWRLSLHGYRSKPHRLETPRGTFLLPKDEYATVRAALDYFQGRDEGEFRLAVVPEGSFFNYFLDSVPVFYFNASLPDLVNTPEREDRFIRDFRDKDIKYVLITSRWASEYGAPIFGRDYLQRGFHHIRKRYRPVAQFGAPLFNPDEAFGALLLEKIPASPQNNPPPARPTTS